MLTEKSLRTVPLSEAVFAPSKMSQAAWPTRVLLILFVRVQRLQLLQQLLQRGRRQDTILLSPDMLEETVLSRGVVQTLCWLCCSLSFKKQRCSGRSWLVLALAALLVTEMKTHLITSWNVYMEEISCDDYLPVPSPQLSLPHSLYLVLSHSLSGHRFKQL